MFGWLDPSNKEFKRCEKIAKEVEKFKDQMSLLSDDELKQKTNEFKNRLKNGETLEDIEAESYAVVREAATRVINKTPFFVQLIGAATIHGGNIAEMKTGEGKTLTAVMPAYLNALSGDAVHIVTVNEYLARREVDGEIGDLFRFLGLTVGLNLRDLTQEEKKEAYKCDILYSTNSELGFDYLRDHMVLYKKDMVQRGLDFAIIDEVDSILIDEARTPLIISGGEKNTANLYIQADKFAKRLNSDDYFIDIESRTIELSEQGISKAEQAFGISNLYDLEHVSLLHHINNALKANYIMRHGVEYMVQDDQVLIIDQFTGRILKGRQYSEGLHQAIEAKENVEIKKETITIATITYQNYFRMYKKLAGMTGTAKTEEEEFVEIYNMYVVEIPTNKPVIRNDAPDLIFVTQEAKYKAIIDEVKSKYEIGQPVLLGTIAVETSELLSKMLKKAGIPHNVLNAKQHEREAEIIAHAGELKSVTIATNMAGRGTDIKLGEGVKELGGLAVIGSERHESRRIDNQLRGRSGRQGDPGYSRFFLSAEDELMQRFGGESFKRKLELIQNLNQDENGDKPLESKMFSKFISSAQKRIEGSNYDSRKHVMKYDDVLRIQRDIIYAERTEVLTKDSIEDLVLKMMDQAIDMILNSRITQDKKKITIDDEGIIQDMNNQLFIPLSFRKSQVEELNVDEIYNFFHERAHQELFKKKNMFPLEIYNEFLKVIVLKVVDNYWTKHIDTMSGLRQGVTLQSYAQGNPLEIYRERGFELFQTMNNNISKDVTKLVLRAQITSNLERKEAVKQNKAVSGKEEETKKQPVKSKEKVGRNDPCPCGSGKKYKHCCGA